MHGNKRRYAIAWRALDAIHTWPGDFMVIGWHCIVPRSHMSVLPSYSNWLIRINPCDYDLPALGGVALANTAVQGIGQLIRSLNTTS